MILDKFIKSQIFHLTELDKMSSEIKEKVSEKAKETELIAKNIAQVKKLFLQKNFDELIKVHKSASEQIDQVPLKTMKAAFTDKLEQLQVESFASIEERFKVEFIALLEKFTLVYQGCSVCKLAQKVLENKCSIHKMSVCSECLTNCSSCNKVVCKKCMKKPCSKNCGTLAKCMNCVVKCLKCQSEISCEKCDFGCKTCQICSKCLSICEKCEKKVCIKCHGECTRKHIWYNGSDTFIRDVNSEGLISTKFPLPNAFKAEIQISGCNACCWTIGITEKQFDGTAEYSYGKRSNYCIGPVSGLSWKEYAWALCNCQAKCDNGNTS